jgi:hypothetical protein
MDAFAGFTQSKCLNEYDLAVATKQQNHFCEKCNTTTNHVTSYSQIGNSLVATVSCTEHSELAT